VRAPAAAAALAVLAVAVYVVARQPISSPWWIYADPDASYAASSLNILDGENTSFFGHPGMPEQELLAATFGAQHLWNKLSDPGARSMRSYVDSKLSNLDSARAAFRGWAIAFFVLGALVTFWIVTALLGHWGWGLLGGLLWVAAPDFATGSIQIRPDVLLSLLSLVTVFLVVRGAQRRDAGWYLLAAVVLGFTVTVKVHAIGLLPALVLAVVLRPPAPGWPERLRLRLGALARRRVVQAGLTVWLVLAIVLNRNHFPFTPTHTQTWSVVTPLLVVAAWLALTLYVRNRVLEPFYPTLAAAMLAGIAIPMTFFLDQGFRMAGELKATLTGGGPNQKIPLFTLVWQQFEGFPLREALLLFVFAGLAALVALRRRQLTPVLWFVAAGVMGVMGAARLGALRYFEPAYVLSIPPALWLFTLRRAATVPLAAAVLVAYVVYPTLAHSPDPARAARTDERYAAAISSVSAPLLAPTDVAIAPDYAPIADVRYWAVVQNFVAHVPPHTYRFLPDYAPALPSATSAGERVHYYFGPAAVDFAKPAVIQLASGPWLAQPVALREPEPFGGVVELLSPPGHPDARYDKATNSFRTSSGQAYDVAGNPQS
jgi:hypothetical protein